MYISFWDVFYALSFEISLYTLLTGFTRRRGENHVFPPANIPRAGGGAAQSCGQRDISPPVYLRDKPRSGVAAPYNGGRSMRRHRLRLLHGRARRPLLRQLRALNLSGEAAKLPAAQAAIQHQPAAVRFDQSQTLTVSTAGEPQPQKPRRLRRFGVKVQLRPFGRDGQLSGGVNGVDHGALL